MIARHIVFAILSAIVLGGSAHAQEDLPRTGLYEVVVRLELPHLERYAADRKTMVCIGPGRRPDSLPLPVFSGNGALADCSAREISRVAGILKYDIVCAGRAAARATAAYDLARDRFRGRVAMVLGAKNMTMTEVQNGRRIGQCGVGSNRRN